MAPALTPSQTALIKSTVPILALHGETLTKKFYHDLLAAHPALKNIFNTTHQATGHQPRALAGALHAYAANIDDLGNLSPALELICHKHASLNVQPEHYDVVGAALLETMASVLGAAVATPELLDAWGAAYRQLADVMIRKEAGLYAATREWAGWREFRVARKEKESDEIMSFYFEPADGVEVEVPRFKPGQYVSVNVFVEGLDGGEGVWQARQYSLSDAPGKKYLRISVKREVGDEQEHGTRAGYVSNILHDKKNVGDVVKLTHPFGDFFFDGDVIEKDTPVVLISAGVGLTCLMSILNTLGEKEGSRRITWIHGARDSRVRAFKKHVDGLASGNDNINRVYFSSSPAEEDLQGRDYDIKGRIDLDKVEREYLFTGDKKTQYFVCGPTQFMLEVEAKLKAFGVDSGRVHMELFGTGGVPRV